MFLPNRFFYTIACIVVLLIVGHFVNAVYYVAMTMLAVLALLLGIDALLLWHRSGITADRQCSQRFSCGDNNEVAIHVSSTYPFVAQLNIIDEIPFIFQRRDIDFAASVQPHQTTTVTYLLRPTKRGIYGFGKVQIFVRTRIGLLQRRFSCAQPVDIKVYPGYLMLNRYELLAMSNQLNEMGIKRIRRAGNNTEFEEIKDYVAGDNYRTINWQATARRNRLMVNIYEDERSQHIISVIDKGRVMQQAFNGMTLLDYAINAALVISYVAIHKDDRAGLLTFDRHTDTYIAAEKHPSHLQRLLEALYAQQTDFCESDFSNLCLSINRLIRRRCLLILYTSFSNIAALERQLPYLQQLNRRHRLLVVFFDDPEMTQYIASKATDTEQYYQHVIAEKVVYERQLIVSSLRQAGIHALLTTPDNLSINLINKYLEMKARGLF